MKPDADAVDMDLEGSHKVKPSASTSACVAVADVVVDVEGIRLLVDAYPGFAVQAGFDPVVEASRHSQQRQLGLFYHDPMAFVSSVGPRQT